MKKSKFNPRHFTGKKRIERAISSNPGISKIWVWDESKLEYTSPERGNSYVATRKRGPALGAKEEKKTFSSLAEARTWRLDTAPEKDIALSPKGPTFGSILKEYQTIRLPQLKPSTRESYEKMIRNYLIPLLEFHISEITPTVIDSWINYLRDLPRTNRRGSFTHELNLLSGVLKFHAEYDDSFQLPIKPRHRKNAIIQKASTGKKDKYLNLEDFFKFRKYLLDGPYGRTFWTMATIQYFQALRISEVAGLHWEDIKWNLEELSNSEVHISKSVFFSRKKGMEPVLQNSFKNSEVNGGVKTAPLFKESYLALEDYQGKADRNKKGLMFTQEDGSLFTYRQIQNAYDLAFKKAGLSFRGTHVMRHGGGSTIYNQTNGDLDSLKAVLGNADIKSVMAYAHRDPKALKEHAKRGWEEQISLESAPSLPTLPHKSHNL